MERYSSTEKNSQADAAAHLYYIIELPRNGALKNDLSVCLKSRNSHVPDECASM
jgi:hypothetical protein